MGTCPTKQHIFIIDFGLSKQYRNSETNIYIPFCDGLPLIGTAHYASVNALMGVELSHRNNIKSLAYIPHARFPLLAKYKEQEASSQCLC